MNLTLSLYFASQDPTQLQLQCSASKKNSICAVSTSGKSNGQRPQIAKPFLHNMYECVMSVSSPCSNGTVKTFFTNEHAGQGCTKAFRNRFSAQVTL